jgi:FtsH-binding integral membrane protein
MQPQIYSPVRTADIALSQNRVLRNTYLLLALTMVPTVLGALIGMQLNFGIVRSNPILSFFAMIAVFYGFIYAIEKNRDSGLGVVLLLGFTFVMGVMLALLLQLALSFSNGGQIIALAAAGTGATFFGMAGIATTTRRDFSFLGKFLLVGVIIAMIAIVASVFLQIPALSLTISAVIALISALIILYTVNQIVQGGETNYVSATLSIYVGVYNLFASLVHLLTAFTGDRE